MIGFSLGPIRISAVSVQLRTEKIYIVRIVVSSSFFGVRITGPDKALYDMGESGKVQDHWGLGSGISEEGCVVFHVLTWTELRTIPNPGGAWICGIETSGPELPFLMSSKNWEVFFRLLYTKHIR